MEDRLAVLRHELRSPVAALVAIAETLAERREQLEEATLLRLLELALAAGRDVERIALDAAPTSLQPELVDPAKLVAETVTAARLRGAAIRADAEPGLPPLRADPVRMRQALANLIRNALAHSPPGIDVVVSARVCGDAVELAVVDQGEGVARERQDVIFDPGVRFAEGAGEGIGLAVARAIAEAHGGRIELESSPGAGATFRLVLPLDAGSV